MDITEIKSEADAYRWMRESAEKSERNAQERVVPIFRREPITKAEGIPNVRRPWPAPPQNEQERKRAHAQALAETGKREAELERLREADARGELTPNQEVRLIHLTGEDESPADGDGPGAGPRRARQPGLDSDIAPMRWDEGLTAHPAGGRRQGEEVDTSKSASDRIGAILLMAEAAGSDTRRIQLAKLEVDSGGGSSFRSYAEGQMSRITR